MITMKISTDSGHLPLTLINFHSLFFDHLTALFHIVFGLTLIAVLVFSLSLSVVSILVPTA